MTFSWLHSMRELRLAVLLLTVASGGQPAVARSAPVRRIAAPFVAARNTFPVSAARGAQATVIPVAWQRPGQTTSPPPVSPPSSSPSTRKAAANSPRYLFRKQHDPNGIGKFYMGREIAHVMGAAAAPWLERPEREREEALSKLVPLLKLKAGQVVADIGAGSGVITLQLAEAVGPEGRVVAVDIQQEMLDLLARKLKQRKVEHVVLVKGTDKTAKLKEHTLDFALMVDVYHEFAFPYEMLQNISQALKPGGRIAFVEYRGEDPAVPIKLVHKMTEAQVKREASLPEFQLRWQETVSDLPWQHVIIFEKLEKKPRAGVP